jgi:hypothetical protein
MKELRITSSKIEVSANPHSPKGYYAFHEVMGILPGCRKEVKLTFSPMSGYVWVNPLYGYNGTASIDPTEWAKLVKASKVVSARHSPYPLTDEVIADAYADALSITACPAITSREYVHPNYQPKFDPMVVVNG